MSMRLDRAKAVWTRSAISLRASSRDQSCVDGLDTWNHLSRHELAPPDLLTSSIRRGVHAQCSPILAQVRAVKNFLTVTVRCYAPGDSIQRAVPIHRAVAPPWPL